jgi:hypothetical protein
MSDDQALYTAIQAHVASLQPNSYVSSFYCIVASEQVDKPGETNYTYLSGQSTAVHVLWGLASIGLRHIAQLMDRHRSSE